mgnify:CR=1 FL=1
MEDETPTIDGHIDDEAWNLVKWRGDYHQYEQPSDDEDATQEIR